MILHALEQGKGPAVCLLHGLWGRAQNLGGVARRLAPGHRVLSLDLRNHGDSPHTACMGYAVMAGDVLETLADRGALPACVLGHSMGGKVAMMLALQAPAQVLRLAVADIAPVRYAHANAQVAAALKGLALTPGLDRRGADAALAAEIPDPAIRGFLLQNLVFGAQPRWRVGLDEIAANMADIEGWPDLPAGSRYPGPVLFVAGARSDYVRPEAEPAIRALFAGAAVVRLEGAGHWLHADQPEAFGRAVEGFFNDGHLV